MKTSLKTFPRFYFDDFDKDVSLYRSAIGEYEQWRRAFEKELREKLKDCREGKSIHLLRSGFIEEVLGE